MGVQLFMWIKGYQEDQVVSLIHASHPDKLNNL